MSTDTPSAPRGYLAAAQGLAIDLGGGLLATAALIDTCAASLEALVADMVTNKLSPDGGGLNSGGAKAAPASSTAKGKKGAKGKGAAADDDDDDDMPRKGGSKGSKSTKRAKQDAMLMLDGAVEDSDEEEMQVSKKGKAGKKGKKGKGAIGGGGGGEIDGAGGDGGDVEGSGGGEGAMVDAITSALVAARPQLEEMTELPVRLASHLLPSTRKRIFDAVESKREASAGERRKAAQGAREATASLAANVQLFAKGLASLKDLQPKDAEALDKALLKGTCTDLLNAMIRAEALLVGLSNIPGGMPGDTPLGAAERKELIGQLPGTSQRALSELEKALGAKSSVGSFLDALQASEEALGAQCQPMDKKREKAAVDKARGELRARLGAEAEPALVLHLAVLVLHIELGGIMLEAPGRLLLPLIDALQPKVSPHVHSTFVAYQKAVQTKLHGGEGAESAGIELLDGLEAVRAFGLGKGDGC